MLPKLAAALLLAGFIEVLLPREKVARWIGEHSGLRGLAVASAAGMITPGGPMTSFPLVNALHGAGTGRGALVAYLTSWSTLGFQRIVTWELPLMGVEFTALRFVASLPLPLVAGLISRLLPRFQQRRRTACLARVRDPRTTVTNSATFFLFGLAAVLGVMALRRGRDTLRLGLEISAERFAGIIPRIAVALLTAGFVAMLMPGEPIAAAIGPESGWRGILIASLAGGFVPAGPIISFPLVVVLYKAGAGIPQLVAFLTAWSVFAFHRVLIYEMTLMGWRFSAVRFVSSLVLPLLAGFFAAGLMRVIPVS